MIISNTLKFFFIHNPKVAGTSVRKSLLKYNSSEIELWHQRYIQSLDRIVDMSHLAARDVTHVLDIPEDYFKFGFIREPYDRFFSAVKEHSRQNSIDLSSKEVLSEFVLNSLTPTSVRFDWNFSHFCPQHYYFYEGNRRIADFIGNHSNIESDWKKILCVLQLDPELHQLSKERFTGSESMSYDSILKRLSLPALYRINQLYAKDWFWFGTYFQSKMLGGLPSGTHQDNVFNVRTLEGRSTFYGEPDNLSVPEKLGFLTSRVESLQNQLKALHENDIIS